MYDHDVAVDDLKGLIEYLTEVPIEEMLRTNLEDWMDRLEKTRDYLGELLEVAGDEDEDEDEEEDEVEADGM